MFHVEDNVETRHDVWKSEIRVKKLTPAIKKLLKYFKNPKPLDEESKKELEKLEEG